MNDFHTLQQQVRAWESLKAQEAELLKKIDTMEHLLPQLETEVENEREDVTNLERGGIVSMFYSAIGRQEEKLDKERQEAQAAEVKYRDALQTCQQLYYDLEQIRAQLEPLKDCAARYQAALQQRQQTLRQGTGPDAERYRLLTEKAAACQKVQKELEEALNAGDHVLDQIFRIEDSLKGASNWGIADMISDSFLTDMFKYGKLDNAQQEISELNRLLRIYSRELKDLDVDLNLSANIGSGMQFADFFFDNIFTDAMAFNRINRLRDQVADIRNQVEYYRDVLLRQQQATEATLRDLKRQAEDLLSGA